MPELIGALVGDEEVGPDAGLAIGWLDVAGVLLEPESEAGGVVAVDELLEVEESAVASCARRA